MGTSFINRSGCEVASK